MMSYKMKTGMIFSILFLFIILSISAECTGNGNTAHVSRQRPPVVFNHDSHMGNNECRQCHHRYENGKNVLVEDELASVTPDGVMTLDISSQKELNGIKCASCHNSRNKINKIGIRDAFHRQCIGCHEAKSAGPVLCGECHKRSIKKSAGE